MPIPLAGCCPGGFVRAVLASDSPAPDDGYTPEHDDSGGGLFDLLASTQMILLVVLGVVAVVLLVWVHFMHRREDRNLEREAPRGPAPQDREGE
ncbi:hypothetical protein [Streptomyces ureilyticus]|uniref:Uncharacterized protein n=1 Tax=Streptomyces ureilyticus TaxID=1775131 RepID=A0ABX0DXH5_9ACTN|nr:hypothetical protein [Streptomyces ureilyticus]NGO43816.1 hypothetical protein [Streptomyces ureilyticus]